MRINILGLEISWYLYCRNTKQRKAQAILGYCTSNYHSVNKIALIKSARMLDNNLGLKAAKELIEELFSKTIAKELLKPMEE